MKKHLKKAWNDTLEELSESRRYVFAAAILFFVFAIVGFVFSGHLTIINILLKQIVTQVRDLSGIRLIVYIFLNNSQSALMSLVLGIGLGIVPVMNAVFNGLVIGYVLSKVFVIGGFSEVWKILPHGIFELPAIFIALGVGMRLGTMFFDKTWRKKVGERIYRAALIFVFVILPLLLIAAIIEGLVITFLK